MFIFIFVSFNRRASGPIVKRIDNYGPPNAKSPFGASDEKSETKTEIKAEETATKKSESQSTDKIVSQATDSSGKFL